MLQRNRDIDRRSRLLAQGARGAGPVVYWMSRDQRVLDNWALLWAQQEALIREKALCVVFCLGPDLHITDRRNRPFMLQGLAELQKRLARYNIGFHLLEGSPAKTLPGFLAAHHAHLLAADFDPLRGAKKGKEELLRSLSLPYVEIDAHNIIPVWITSEKKEYGAYTIRPKINRLFGDYLTDFPPLSRHPYPGPPGTPPGRLPGDNFQTNKRRFRPGEQAAAEAMAEALLHRLPRYSEDRNNPCLPGQSDLSPYLHFGHLSAQRLAWSVYHSELADAVKKDFLEELVVRRELADNYCYYEPDYDRFRGFPEWARKTMDDHRHDKRRYCYCLEDLEQAGTHEPLWNACQRDLVANGKLHGYLRMYWAKKILEWTSGPEEALAYAIILNDRYSLDGCDPNGYTGIAWSIGGIHDRAWPERQVFGKVRYMNENGCRRKFDVDSYIQSIAALDP